MPSKVMTLNTVLCGSSEDVFNGDGWSVIPSSFWFASSVGRPMDWRTSVRPMPARASAMSFRARACNLRLRSSSRDNASWWKKCANVLKRRRQLLRGGVEEGGCWMSH